MLLECKAAEDFLEAVTSQALSGNILEEQQLQQLADEVGRKAEIGFVRVAVVPFFDPYALGVTGVAGVPVIVAGCGVTSKFTRDHLRGIIAHEMGHVAYGDFNSIPCTKYESYSRELRCDMFAARLGYGDGLGGAMCLVDKMLRECGGSFGEDEHPPVEVRLAALAKFSKGAK